MAFVDVVVHETKWHFLALFLRICSYFMFQCHKMTILFKVSATCMDTLLCEIYCRRFLALFRSSFLVFRESSNLSTKNAKVIYGNNKFQEILWMRALWSKAFSLVFYLKVNSTFQNWTIIFVHFGISENSFELFVLLKREAYKRSRQRENLHGYIRALWFTEIRYS